MSISKTSTKMSFLLVSLVIGMMAYVSSAFAYTVKDLYVIDAYVGEDCKLYVKVYNAWGTTPMTDINLSVRGLYTSGNPTTSSGVNIGWRNSRPMVEDEFDTVVYGPLTVFGSGPLIVGFTTFGNSTLINPVQVTKIPSHCYKTAVAVPCTASGQNGYKPRLPHMDYDVNKDGCVTMNDGLLAAKAGRPDWLDIYNYSKYGN